MKTLLQVLGLLLAATTVAVAEMRTWTFEQSSKTMEGEVVAFAGSAVTLKGADGKTVSVPIAYLIQSDRSYLAAERSKQWKEVEVVKLNGSESGGRYKKCTVKGKDVNGEIFIERLPPSVEAILKDRNLQAAPITNLSAQIASQTSAVQDAKASMPTRTTGSRGYQRVVRAERAQINREAKSVKDLQAELAHLEKAYDDSVQKTRAQTMVKMKNTGGVYKALPLWECLDPRKPQ